MQRAGFWVWGTFWFLTVSVMAQPPGSGPGGGPGGPGGFGPGMRQTRKILKEYDANNDGWLNDTERSVAREGLKKSGNTGGGRRFGPPGMNRNTTPPREGVHVEPGDVKQYTKAKLYDPDVLRTIFIDFTNKKDWETELEEFHGTDADIAATLTVDGKKYPNVGVRFRGMSSYMMIGKGYKRSFNLSMDMADSKQRLLGARTLNLLNANEDASYLGSILYSYIARQYIAAPKANLVKVVINGENWGVYVNVQQFNKEFLEENFKTTKGARWKVSGSPMGRGGLEYLGDDVERYKRIYEIKSNDNEKSWKALINLCKVLNQTPPDKLEEALKPILDIDGVLWFLALDVALINCDGYWIRASDYSIYLDDKGKFHLIPHDMNEAFRQPGGPGMGGPGMMRMTPGQVLPEPLQQMLQLTEKQKKELATLQKEADAELEKIFTTEQRARWKTMKTGGGMAGGPPGMGGPPGQGGPGMGGPPGMGGGIGRVNGVELDPLVGLNDASKPLRSKLLAVPALKEKYLRNIRTIAEKSLNWNALEPIVTQYRNLIKKEVEADTHKLESYEEFLKHTSDSISTVAEAPRRGPSSGMNLRAFVEQRSKYLLNYKEGVKPAPK